MTWLQRVAVGGGLACAIWHASLIAGRREWWPGPVLLVLFFAVWFPAVIGAARRGITFSGGGRVWMAAAALCGYAFVNMWLLEKQPVQQRWSLALSGILLAFYAVGAALLQPAASARRSVRRAR